MFAIIIESEDGMDQDRFGPYETVIEAAQAIPEIADRYPNFSWVQIEPE